MENNREELVKQLMVVQDQASEIRKQIDAFDYQERFNEANEYVGKCFIEKNHSEHYIRCYCAYGIDKTTCDIHCMAVSYFGDTDSYYEIEYAYNFNPKKWHDEDNYDEIPKDTFREHYIEALKRINGAVQKSNLL